MKLTSTVAAATLGLAVLMVLPACGSNAARPPGQSARASGQAATPSGQAAGASSAAPASSSAATSPDASRDSSCLTADQARRLFFVAGPAGDRLATLSIGTGAVTVILAHQSDGSLCQWWPYAQSLATHFHVVAFDFDGHGASPFGDSDYSGQVAAEARWARQHGGGKIILMGASMGATAVMVAAASLGTSVSGVIYLSGPARYGGMDALAAAPHVHVPALFGYGAQDLGFAGDVQEVRAATAARDKPVVSAGNSDHGVDLLQPGTGSPSIRLAVIQFIQAATRPH